MNNAKNASAHVGKCALCDTENIELKESHSIPKFVYKWVKESSKTGFIRGGDNVNDRLQDGPKEHLLCNDCEGKLSAIEKVFAKGVFKIIANYRSQANSITVTEEMRVAVISIFWRALLTTRHRDNDRTIEDNILFDSFMSSLKHQINAKQCLSKIYFAPFIADSSYYDLPPEMIYNLERSVGGQDIRFYDNPHRFFSLFKVPFIYFYIFSEGWDNEEMKNSTPFDVGSINLTSIKQIPDTLRELILREHDHFEEMKKSLSQENLDKIIKSAEKNKNITGSDNSRTRMIDAIKNNLKRDGS
ncbi:hypothetical protein VH569_13350 [Azospirillum sp. 11R-A]|uniref:hypothetical protein n=1 Tax=Azospirillum sp. 11R-A TaxID=3111634 RepID=UPI003C13C51A